MNILKGTVTEKVIVCFYNLGEENFLKVGSFCNISNFNNGFVGNLQRFKGHLLNELRDPFSNLILFTVYIKTLAFM